MRFMIDVREVAVRLGVSVRTVYRLVAEGRIPPPIRLRGKVLRWVVSELEDHIRGLRAPEKIPA